MQRTSSPAALARKHIRYFPAKRYGYAGAIETGKVVVEKGRLAIETPPLSLSNLPFFSCRSASALMARVLRNEGFQCAPEEISIPILPKGADGQISHQVCLGQERDGAFFVGLTPYDKLIGTFPYKKRSLPIGFDLDFMWASPSPASLSSDKKEEPLLYDTPTWPIPGFNNSTVALFAHEEQNQLRFCSLGIAAKPGTLNILLVAQIMERDKRMFSLSGKWAGSILIETPSHNIPDLIGTVSKPSAYPQHSFEGLLKKGQASFFPLRENESLAHEGFGLFIEAWPYVVTFIKKLPVEAIQTALAE